MGGTVGQVLRTAREAQERSLEAISGETKIPVASLRMLEEDRFADLPGDIFVRGFLRSYCQALSIPEASVMEGYLEQTGAPSEVLLASVSSLGERSIAFRRVRSFSWILALALFLLLGAALLVIIFHPSLGGGEDGRGMGQQEDRASVESTL